MASAAGAVPGALTPGAVPHQAGGLGGALRTLEALPFGTILPAVAAAGLIVYGLYLLGVARYLRLIATR